MDIKNWNFYNNKNSYALVKELTTYLLKRKDFYNQIKILYSLQGVKPNLENKKHRWHPFIIIHSIESITINQSKYIDTFNWMNKNISFIHLLGPWDELNYTSKQS